MRVAKYAASTYSSREERFIRIYDRRSHDQVPFFHRKSSRRIWSLAYFTLYRITDIKKFSLEISCFWEYDFRRSSNVMTKYLPVTVLQHLWILYYCTLMIRLLGTEDLRSAAALKETYIDMYHLFWVIYWFLDFYYLSFLQDKFFIVKIFQRPITIRTDQAPRTGRRTKFFNSTNARYSTVATWYLTSI